MEPSLRDHLLAYAYDKEAKVKPRVKYTGVKYTTDVNQGLIDYIVTPESGFMKHIIKKNINLKASCPQLLPGEGNVTERSAQKERVIVGSRSGPRISDFGSIAGSGGGSHRKKRFRGEEDSPVQRGSPAQKHSLSPRSKPTTRTRDQKSEDARANMDQFLKAKIAKDKVAS